MSIKFSFVLQLNHLPSMIIAFVEEFKIVHFVIYVQVFHLLWEKLKSSITIRKWRRYLWSFLFVLVCFEITSEIIMVTFLYNTKFMVYDPFLLRYVRMQQKKTNKRCGNFFSHFMRNDLGMTIWRQEDLCAFLLIDETVSLCVWRSIWFSKRVKISFICNFRASS